MQEKRCMPREAARLFLVIAAELEENTFAGEKSERPPSRRSCSWRTIYGELLTFSRETGKT
ncbi:hypothetical protein FACS189425_03050 [Clostridia bacterium]|nr:hypothetical protein FACS189425_03050 [Clostridia bacterium]